MRLTPYAKKCMIVALFQDMRWWKVVRPVVGSESLARKYPVPPMARLAKMNPPFPASLLTLVVRDGRGGCHIESEDSVSFLLFCRGSFLPRTLRMRHWLRSSTP